MNSAFDFSDVEFEPWITIPDHFGALGNSMAPECFHRRTEHGLECLFLFGRAKSWSAGFRVRFPGPALWMFAAGDAVSQSAIAQLSDAHAAGFKVQQSPMLSAFESAEPNLRSITTSPAHYIIPGADEWLHVIDNDGVSAEWFLPSREAELLTYFEVAA